MGPSAVGRFWSVVQAAQSQVLRGCLVMVVVVRLGGVVVVARHFLIWFGEHHPLVLWHGAVGSLMLVLYWGYLLGDVPSTDQLGCGEAVCHLVEPRTASGAPWL